MMRACCFGRAEDQRRDCVQEGARQDHQEGNRFHQRAELCGELAIEHRPLGAPVKRRDAYRWAEGRGERWFVFSGGRPRPAGPFLQTETAVGDQQHGAPHREPQQPVAQQQARAEPKGKGVLFGDRPVFGQQLESAAAERIQPRAHEFVVEIVHQNARHGVRTQQQQPAKVGGRGAAGRHGDGEDQGAAKQRVGQRECRKAVEMRLPVDAPPALGIVPGHELRRDHAERSAQQGDHRDQRRSPEPAKEIRSLGDARGKDDLLRLVSEVAGRGRVYKRRRHHDGENADHRVVVQDDEGCVAIGVLQRAAHKDAVGGGRAEDHQAQDQQEHVKHPGPQPVAEFEQEDGTKHTVTPDACGYG